MYQSVLQPLLDGSGAHQLPEALRLRARQRLGPERAFHDGHVGEVQRQSFRPQPRLDHGEVGRAALEGGLEPVAQAALEQVHVRQHLRVRGNRHIVRRGFQIEFHRLTQRGRWGGEVKGRQVQQFVDGRRHRRPLGEPIALRQGADLIGADPIDETIEVLPEAGVRPGALRQFEQAVQRLVEEQFRLCQMPQAHLLLTTLEQALGTRDDITDGVGLNGGRR